MNGLNLDIIAMALGERLKNQETGALTNQIVKEFPYMVLPSLMAEKEGVVTAYCMSDNAVPARHNHWVCYPELNALEEVFSHTTKKEPFAAVKYIDRETDFETFGVKNFMHKHYTTLLATLLVRNCLSRFICQRVDVRPGRYIIKHNREVLDLAQMAEELEIFVNAARTVAEAIIKKKYNLDMAVFRGYFYNAVKAEEANPLHEAKLQALTPPKNPGVNLSKDELGLDGYKSKICGENLQDEVMRFLVDAYNKVYAVI